MPKKHHRSRTAAARNRHLKIPAAPLIALAAVLLIAAAVVLLIPRNTLPAEIDVVRAHEMNAQGALLVDVRPQEEWDQVHIAGSVPMPLDELPGRLSELPRDKDIVVVCRLGERSKEGVTILRQAGFSRSTCMSGGIQAWVDAGYPVER